MRDPAFWWDKPGLLSRLLWPLAAIYGAIAGRRMRRTGQVVGIPVICVGNFTLGGTGKTPTAIAIAHWLTGSGERPFFLTRGYGGTNAGPLQVDPRIHRAVDVGDEPLLLARHAPVIVARDRVAGAAFAQGSGASVIVMDDGLQNPSLEKTFAIAVVDGRRGVGNCAVFPAGPLRAPLSTQLKAAHAILVVGAGPGVAQIAGLIRNGQPLFHARLAPATDAIAEIGGRRVLAFAGIGDPRKFFATLTAAGIATEGEESFPDHHVYTQTEAARLLARAEARDLVPLTTEKDMARLAGGEGALAALHTRAKAMPVTLVIEEDRALQDLLRQTLKR
jgi:tetraacyldisaccharide 4'-kinase